MEPFIHLHVHTQYSLLDGQASIDALIDKAQKDGMNAIAVTDHGNMFGIKEFFNKVSKKNGKPLGAIKDLEKEQKALKGKEALSTEEQARLQEIPSLIEAEKKKIFKPIIGCECYCARNGRHNKTAKEDRSGYHLIILAKNLKGYKNLIKMVSISWTEGFYGRPRIDHELLEKYHEDLIVCSACLGGEIPQHIMHDRIDKAEESILWFKKLFGEDYYLEMQRHETHDPNADCTTYPKQQEVNKVLIELARKHNVKLIATNDVHFVNQEDAEAHDRLICLSTGKDLDDPTRMRYSKQEWMKTTAEMNAIFADIPEALSNTLEIADKVDFYSIDSGPIMPTFAIPEDFGTEESYREKFSEQDLFEEFTRDENGNVVLSEEDAKDKIKKLGGYDKLYRIKLEADYLRKLTYDGAKVCYGDNLNDEVRERLDFELHIMKTMGFPGYFLIVQDFINVAKKQLGVSVGPGRGSAAGSAAAYCLGITQIDPIKYDLLFERFLNPDRISLPDIDVDFDDDGRYVVLKYVTEKYGAEKVAHIITYQTMATKSAIKDVAKVMELPLPESNRLAKLVPDRLPEVNGKAPKINFKNCLAYCKEFEAETHNENPIVREVMKYAGQLEGNVRGTGIHACGVIIGRDDITDWVPISVATDADGSKVISTQYEGSVIEETGLIKMDFLGLKTLSIIKEALANIKQTRGFDLDIEHIPLDDAPTFKLYCDGRTTSTFQFESAGMQNSLRDLQPSKFEDLIAMNALYRPGPMDYIPSFIKRKHGDEPISYDIPIMEKYLEETYGITVYQEQVMLLSRLLSNFTRGESDMLRKAMGKKQIDKMAKLKVKFMDEGQKNGHKAEVLEKIWADWEKFASYAFNKSHATCYTWVAYQTAYLKANYPAEYMAGVLSRNLGAADKLKKIMDECIRMGIDVKGPDINESIEKFGVTKAGQIRFGLGAIKGVGGNAVNAIIAERRENGPYKDIYDFVERVNLSSCNRSSIESLGMAGAFDSLGYMREIFVEPVGDTSFTEMLVKYGQTIQNDKNSMQASLFGDFEPIETARPPIPQVTPWNRLKLLDEEKKLVTIYLSAHPLDPYYMELTYGCNCSCGDFEDKKVAGAKLTMGGMVTGINQRIARNGRPYGVITIEDMTGSVDFMLFANNFEFYKNRLQVGDAVYLKVNVAQSKFKPDRLDVNIEEIQNLDNVQGKMANALTVYLDDRFCTEEFFNKFLQFNAGKRAGDLFIDIYNQETKQIISVHSRKKFSVTKETVAFLDDWGVKYKVTTSS